MQAVRRGLLQVEDLRERSHAGIRSSASERFEKGSHLRLPASIDRMLLHRGAGTLEVRGFQIADEQTIRAQEERVIVPAGLAQGLQHFRPNRSVAAAILVNLFWADFQKKTNPLHGGSCE